MSKRPNAGSRTLDLDGIKCPRVSPPQDQQDAPPPCPYPRLQAARLPADIRALPHVLKQIDIYLMTRNEAATEAASAGLTKWLKDLLPRVDDNGVGHAVLEATAHDHLACVEVLMEEYAVVRGIPAQTNWEKLLEAVVAAATKGHLEVLKVLLAKTYFAADRGWQEASLCTTVREVLLAAARDGHLDVVKIVVQHTQEKESREYKKILCNSNALAQAISGGQKVVVEYLLIVNGFTWDLKEAFVAAVEVGDNALADAMCELYVQKATKDELFTSLSCGGHLNALKYLYETGLNNATLIGKAFVKTAKWTGTDTLEFLLGTGLVSPDAFDRGFEAAATSSRDSVNIVSFLLEKERVSVKAINYAFVRAQSCDVLKILLDHEHISDESICTVFERTTGSLGEYWDYMYCREESEGIRIMKLLYTKDCIPAGMIGRVFVTAASTGHSELVALLRGDGRISARMVGEAFAAAASRENSALMMSLYDSNLSPDAIFVAFSNATARGRMENVKELVKLLSDGDRMPQEFKLKAFVIAAYPRHDAILRLLCESGDGNWPLSTLQDALAVAKHDEVKTFIRKLVCDQLFDSSRHGLVEKVAKLMDTYVDDSATGGK